MFSETAGGHWYILITVVKPAGYQSVALRVHNEFRAKHHAPALSLDNEVSQAQNSKLIIATSCSVHCIRSLDSYSGMQPVALSITLQWKSSIINVLTKTTSEKTWLGCETLMKVLPPPRQPTTGTTKRWESTIMTTRDSPWKQVILPKSFGNLPPSLASACIAIEQINEHTFAPSTVHLETTPVSSRTMYSGHRVSMPMPQKRIKNLIKIVLLLL